MSDEENDFEVETEFDDGPRRAWFVQLMFWRPSILTDSEMELFFSDYDGRWSEQTKSAITRYGAKGLDLNNNWALVNGNWSCPACNRHKVDILRLSDRGILLANLDEHHDHISNYVGRRARELYGEQWLADARPGSARLVDYLEKMVSSFLPVLVCTDCNTADGKAKALMKGGIPDDFSFSPSEIGKFIDPIPNKEHGIDVPRLKETWHNCEESFNDRVKFIDHTLGMIHSGMLYRDRGVPSLRIAQRQFEPEVQLYRGFRRETDRDDRSRELTQMIDEFLARSVQKDSPIVAPKVRTKSGEAVGPTDVEYAVYCDPVSSRRWQQTSEEWYCPICNRKKRQIVRKSNNGRWTGGVRQLIEPVEETDRVSILARRRIFPGFQHDFMMRGLKSTLICSDCADIIARIKQRRRDITDIHLGEDDLRQCVRDSQPNAPHDVDWDETTRRALSNRSIGPAWNAYWKYRSFVFRLAHHYNVTEQYCGGEHKAIDEVSDEIMFESEVDSKEEAIELTRLILQEFARFKEEDSRNDEENAENPNHPPSL
jgi:rubredoxin